MTILLCSITIVLFILVVIYKKYNNKLHASLGKRMIFLAMYKFTNENEFLIQAGMEVSNVFIGPQTGYRTANMPEFKSDVIRNLAYILNQSGMVIEQHKINKMVDFIAENLDTLSLEAYNYARLA
jgi:hypothetical protein